MAKFEKKELPKLPKGMGTYEYVKDRIRYRKTINLNGKQIRLCVTGSSIKEVNKMMKEKEKETVEMGTSEIKDSKALLQDRMEQWLILYKKQDVSSRTYDRIESIFNTHIKGSDIGTTMEYAIDSDMIQKFFIELKHSKSGEPLSYSSKKKLYELLNQYFSYRYIDNPTEINPMVKVKRPVKTEEEHLNEELIIWDDKEIEILCSEASKEFKNGIGGYKHGKAIIFILWTFIRLGEAQALKWEDIDLESGILSISKSFGRVKIRNGKGTYKYEYKLLPTKGKKTRKIKMCQAAIDCISKYKSEKNPKSEDEFVYTGKDGVLTENTIINSYYLICKNAGLPEDKHVTIHGLRHTGISYFLRHGVPVEVVSRMAGHQSIQITLDTYYQVIEEQKARAVESLDELMKK